MWNIHIPLMSYEWLVRNFVDRGEYSSFLQLIKVTTETQLPGTRYTLSLSLSSPFPPLTLNYSVSKQLCNFPLLEEGKWNSLPFWYKMAAIIFNSLSNRLCFSNTNPPSLKFSSRNKHNNPPTIRNQRDWNLVRGISASSAVLWSF